MVAQGDDICADLCVRSAALLDHVVQEDASLTDCE